jgi:hypothetical protein
MSWDAFLVRIKGKSIPENTWEAEEIPLGTRKQVIDAILAEFPAARQQSTSEFLYTDGHLSIGFTLKGKSPVREVALEVRGAGDPITPLLHLATSNGWLIMDVSTSEYIDPKKPSKSGYGQYVKMTREALGKKRTTGKPAKGKKK